MCPIRRRAVAASRRRCSRDGRCRRDLPGAVRKQQAGHPAGSRGWAQGLSCRLERSRKLMVSEQLRQRTVVPVLRRLPAAAMQTTPEGSHSVAIYARDGFCVRARLTNALDAYGFHCVAQSCPTDMYSIASTFTQSLNHPRMRLSRGQFRPHFWLEFGVLHQ